MPHNAASDQGLYCVLNILQFIDLITDSNMDLLKFLAQLWYGGIYGKYGSCMETVSSIQVRI